MADSLSLDIKASLSWLFEDQLDLSAISDAAKLEYSEGFADGTSANQVDKLWHDERTLTSGFGENLDLTALTNVIFGSTVTITFVKVKAVLIINMSTTSGDDLLVGGAGFSADAWSPPFNGDQNAKVSVPAGSTLLLVNKIDGWAVTDGSDDKLRVENTSGNSVNYRIAIVGTSV
ncbi:MAG: hypothetical protein IIA44_12770 [Acidobacteria bacterium]|nr:hypothetical protein [Acidobacteriota bacterium]